MTATYLTWDQARLDGAWQGIRRLELALTGLPPRATLTVHLAQAATGLRAADLVIEGPRVPEITSVTFAGTTAVIELASIGSRATYWLRLLGGGAHPLHPLFAMASFQFAIDCESADCRPTDERAPRVDGPAPPVDYATRDHDGFQELLAAHARVRHDDWGSTAPAAQEQLLVDLLAHHGDLLAYFQDRVGNEAFVATARTRHALRQHGLLLGYDVNEGVAGTTVLAFEVTTAGWVPAGLAVRTQTRDGDEPIHYVTRARERVRPEHSRLIPAAWPGAIGARLPAGTTRLLLWGHDLGLRAGMRLAFHGATETFLVTLTGAVELSLPGWVRHPSDPPTMAAAAVTEIAWNPRQAPPRELAPWLPAADGGDELVTVSGSGAIVSNLRGNLVDAAFGEPRTAATGAGAAPVRLDRGPRGATVETVEQAGGPVRLVRALRLPEAPLVWERDEAGASVPALTLAIDGQPWFRQAHLHGSRPFDRHFAVAVADDGVAWLQFGDGERGARVLETADLVVHYRRGRTGNGNCPRGVLQVIDPPLPGTAAADDLDGLGASAVVNVVAGTGSIAAETDDAIRESIPRSLRHGELARAVSLADYARAASQVKGVARATARALGGVFNTVLILIDPEGQTELDPELREAVRRHVDRVRMAGREHVVGEARYLPLDVELWVCAEPGVPRHHVRERVLAALRPGTGDRRGWFHPDRLSFAESVEVGEVLAVVQALPGVRSVKAVRFRRLLVASDELVEARIAVRPTEVARLDADLAHPEHGRLEVKVVGLGGIDESRYQIATAGGPP